jgi:hypothetical protein
MFSFRVQQRKMLRVMKFWKPISMATVLMMTCTPPPSFSDDIDKIERLTVAYIFNFAKFIEWEVLENSKADVKPLSICFYGALGNMSKYTFSLEQKKIKQRSVKTKKLSRGDDIADCEIIYISESESKYVNLLLAHAEKNNMLTISRLDSFMESGGMIELRY